MVTALSRFLPSFLIVAGLLTLLCVLPAAPARAGGGGPTAGAPGMPPGDPCCGDPITLGTGNLFEQATDYETAGPNKLSLIRYYNTDFPGTVINSGTIFNNWRSNYDTFLYIPNFAPFYVDVIRSDNKNFHFVQSASGRWQPPPDISGTLVQAGPNYTIGTKFKYTDWNDTEFNYVVSVLGANFTGQFALAELASIKYRGGYSQTLKYNADCGIDCTGSGQLASVTDSYGRQLTFSYVYGGSGGNQSNTVYTVTTPDATQLQYAYSVGAPSALTSVTYPTSPPATVNYVYPSPVGFNSTMTGIIDEDGNQYASWSYDTADSFAYEAATSSQLGAGANLTSVAYNGDGSRLVTNALGQQELYKFGQFNAGSSGLVPVVTEIDRIATTTTAAATRLLTYDKNGYYASITDWNGNLTKYVNDSRGLPTMITEAAGTPQQRVTRIAWDKKFHLPDQIVAPELTTSFTYDADGNVLTRTLTDTTNNSFPYSTNGETRTWTYTWAKALPTSITDPNGNTTSLNWDASGALVAISNALGQTTQITQHLPGGLPLTIVDPNGVTTQLAYDARNRLISSTVATAAGPLSTSYAYDPAGNLIQVTQPDGSALSGAYDQAHRLIALIDLLNDQLSFTLDGLGDVTNTTWSIGKAVKRTHSGVFDALGRRVQDIGGVGQTTTYAYDSNGNATSITDPDGNATARAFDPLNRLVQSSDPTGGATAIAYDPQDHPIQVADPNGNATAYVYDGFGDVIAVRSPDTGDTVYTYDPNGNLIERDKLGIGDAEDIVTTWSYDALNRPTARSYPGDPAENVAYAYDQAGAGFGIGRLTSLSDAAGTLAFTYDERGNALSQTRTIGAATLATIYAYDAASRIIGITYPSGAAVAYSRDAMGRITSVSLTPPGAATAQQVVSGIGYEPFGPADGLGYGNGIAETWAFDRDYRPTTLTEAGSTTRTLGYGYDPDNNVLKISDTLSGGSQTFAYDALDRLTSASGFYGKLQYQYDPVGNVLTQSTGGKTLTFAYALGSNQLQAINSGSASVRQFAYTPTGNIANDQRATNALALAYNQDDRLASVTIGAAAYGYVYDAFGQRLEKQQPGTAGQTTLYQYDLSGHLLEENALSSNGATPQTDYLYLGDRPIAMLTNGIVEFFQDDRLGTPQTASDASQALSWQALYQPFGQIELLVTGLTQNLRFPGQYADAESGYYHNGFRDYDPSIERYIESDPVGLRGGLNTYTYGNSNPVNRVDPLGLCDLPRPPWWPPILPWPFGPASSPPSLPEGPPLYPNYTPNSPPTNPPPMQTLPPTGTSPPPLLGPGPAPAPLAGPPPLESAGEPEAEPLVEPGGGAGPAEKFQGPLIE